MCDVIPVATHATELQLCNGPLWHSMFPNCWNINISQVVGVVGEGPVDWAAGGNTAAENWVNQEGNRTDQGVLISPNSFF